MKNMTVLVAALAAGLASPADSAGLRTKFGEVVVQGLKIGQTYSLKDLVNLPYGVVNTGTEETELLIDVVWATSDVVKVGYEQIGALDWVKLQETRFTVAPNREVATDVTISIPNDESLLGRRFQASIWARTRAPRGVLAAGMQSRLLIHVDSTPPTEEELKRKFVNKRLANLDFSLLPTHGTADAVPLGKPVDLRKHAKVSVKIVNPNDDALNFRIRSIPTWESLLTVPPGYEPAYNPQWLKPAKEVVKVDGNSIMDTGLIVEIPDAPLNRGKKFFFSVGVEVLEQEIPTRFYYRLHVHTQGGPDAAETDETKKP
ncbi:MAG: hypothetical protein SF051_00040 [Elusimicrobiota bacterium]|nr:hypothetical protein [Elusimicrobiota bacterium]